MKRFPQCERITKAPIIPLEEKQSKIIFENPTKLEVCVLRVDHTEKDEGAIKDGIRCDYALTAEKIEAEFYIELKGRDIKHAFEQLEITLQQISQDPQNHPKCCFVISTRCTLTGTEIQKMTKLMKQRYNARLTIKNRQHLYVLS